MTIKEFSKLKTQKKMIGIRDIIKINPENRVLFYPGAGTDFEIIMKANEYYSAFNTFVLCDFDAYELRKSNINLPNPRCEPEISFLENKMGLQGLDITGKQEFNIRDEQYTACQLELNNKYGSYRQYITDKINIVSYQIKGGIQIFYFKAEALALKNTLLNIFPNLNRRFSVYLHAFTGGGYIFQSLMYSMTGPLMEGLNGEIPVMAHQFELANFLDCNRYSPLEIIYEKFEEFGYIIYRDKAGQTTFFVEKILAFIEKYKWLF